VGGHLGCRLFGVNHGRLHFLPFLDFLFVWLANVGQSTVLE